ncbi:MAG TPA: histidine kinase [Acetobacteraceae bacterium]|nr:histidine kinase [Acetobacteraceae bacterium]
MSLRGRLLASLSLVLLACLLVGTVLTCLHAVAQVRTELASALDVGRHFVANAVADSDETPNKRRRLAQIVGAFDGHRHLRAVLRDGDGRVLLASMPQKPDDEAPALFLDLVAGKPLRSEIALPPAFAPYVLSLEADPHGEAAEAWSDLLLTCATLALFFALGLGLMTWMVGRALVPLRALCRGLEQIGGGAYAARMAPVTYRELEPARLGFNDMARRLAEMEAQNNALQEQVQQVQDEERRELARDLHDEVAPFLFAVGADAAVIRQSMQTGACEMVDARADAIIQSVRHMQRHVRSVLSRLMPSALLDLGLAGAIDSLAAFWRMRHPGIDIVVDIDPQVDERTDERTRAVIFRVVQESLSNSVRHGAPSCVSIRVAACGGTLTVEITDDGQGLAAGGAEAAFGIRGMKERLASVGGSLRIGAQADVLGVAVHAVVPCTGEMAELS